MSPHAILLLDDDLELLNALGKFLTKQGFAVTRMNSPVDAAEFIGGPSHFDLVITDLRMPGINGFTMLSALRQTHPRIPVIVLTAFASPGTRAEALKRGAKACLEKPVDTKALLETIGEALHPDA